MIFTWIRFTRIILTRLTKITIETIAVECAMKDFTITSVIAWIASTRCNFTCFTTVSLRTFAFESITIMSTYSIYTWVTMTWCFFTINTKIPSRTTAFVCITLKSTRASILAWFWTARCYITCVTALLDSRKLLFVIKK